MNEMHKIAVVHIVTIVHIFCSFSLQLISLGAASSGLSELIVAINRSQDPYKLSDKLIPHLEVLLKFDVNIDKSKSTLKAMHVVEPHCLVLSPDF